VKALYTVLYRTVLYRRNCTTLGHQGVQLFADHRGIQSKNSCLTLCEGERKGESGERVIYGWIRSNLVQSGREEAEANGVDLHSHRRTKTDRERLGGRDGGRGEDQLI
jgi:hypothetical protein